MERCVITLRGPRSSLLTCRLGTTCAPAAAAVRPRRSFGYHHPTSSITGFMLWLRRASVRLRGVQSSGWLAATKEPPRKSANDVGSPISYYHYHGRYDVMIITTQTTLCNTARVNSDKLLTSTMVNDVDAESTCSDCPIFDTRGFRLAVFTDMSDYTNAGLHPVSFPRDSEAPLQHNDSLIDPCSFTV